VGESTRVRAVTLFSRGDARRVTTWSGLPLGCAQALETAGVTVHRVDLSPGPWAQGLIRQISRLHRWWPAVSGWRPDKGVAETLVLSFSARRKIATACRQYPDSQCNVFMTYSFSSRRLSDLPVVHYCDQCYAELLESIGQSRLSWAERVRLREEKGALRRADLLIATNLHCIDFLRERYGLENVFPEPVYGMSLVGYRGRPLAQLESKRQSTDIVFVGTSVKGRGLDLLLEAFREFNRAVGGHYTLHIVGFEKDAVPGEWPSTRWYGRLDKDDPAQASVYWSLIDAARMFVIPSRSGPLPGVILEAQYLGTPVITTSAWRVEQIVQDGETGLVIDEPTPESVFGAMLRLASDDGLWDDLALKGHEMARGWLWEQAAAVLIEQLTRVAPGSSLARDP